MGLLDSIGLVIAKKWIAGTKIEDAIKQSNKLNSLGEKAMINYLGEELTEGAKINDNVKTYLSVLKQMKASGTDGCIAVKPTQLGLNVNYPLFVRNYGKIVSAASKLGIFVWLDMEDHMFVDDTIKAYLHELKKYQNTGICIQSKLRRSMSDIKNITKRVGAIRLVKGAYPNHGNITYNSKNEIDNNYERCMHYLFKHSKSFMIATHDDKLIEKALSYQKKYKRKLMFGMLNGIRPTLALKLAKQAKEMYVYLPFGSQWLAYSIRRLKESGHAMLIIRSLFQG